MTPPKAAGCDEEENTATDAGTTSNRVRLDSGSTGNRVRLDSSLLPTVSAESVDVGGATWQTGDVPPASGSAPSLTDDGADASAVTNDDSSFPAVLRMTRYEA